MKKVWEFWLNAEDNPPTKNGYYAVLVAWPSDPFEGWMPDWGLWLGDKWEETIRHGGPVSHRSKETFASKEEAQKWAEEHDPN